MKIPKQIKVGQKWYTVEQPPVLGLSYQQGNINYAKATMCIAKLVNGKALSPGARSEVFWHETIHAMLYDMGSPLHKNETFVEALAVRLQGVINSARF